MSRAVPVRTIATLVRVLRDPTLLPDVWGKASARFSATRHRKRVGAYEELALEFTQGLARLLGLPPSNIEETIGAETFHRLLGELETFVLPPRAKGMGGAAYLEACYAIVRLTRPKVVLETGVALGNSSAMILGALEENRVGKLFSIDLPTFRPGVTSYTGAAVPERLRSSARWQLHLGPQRRVLPNLLSRIEPVDFFVYDSDKSYEGMMHTWRLVWPHLRPGATVMLDDVHDHDALLDFADEVGLTPIVVPKPIRRSVYRWDKVFYVGLLRKPEN